MYSDNTKATMFLYICIGLTFATAFSLACGAFQIAFLFGTADIWSAIQAYLKYRSIQMQKKWKKSRLV